MSTGTNDIQVVYRNDPKHCHMQEIFWSRTSSSGADRTRRNDAIIDPRNQLFQQMIGKEIILTTRAQQLTLLGQQFRPVFYGKVVYVTDGYMTLDPVQAEFPDKTKYSFMTPLHFPIERVSNFAPHRLKGGRLE